MNGGSPRDAHEGVYIVGPQDEWLARQKPEAQRHIADDAAATLRAEQIELYYDQQKNPRRQPGVADGVGKSAFFD